MPDTLHIPPVSGKAGPRRTSEALRDEWRKIYATMSTDELHDEDNALLDEMMFLAGLSYVDESRSAINKMKRDLIAEILRD